MTEMMADAFAAMVSTDIGITVTYTRPSVGNVTLCVIPGRSTFKTDDNDAGSLSTRTTDFIAKSDDLKINGTIIKPKRGDTIAMGPITYDVNRPGGETAYRYSDPARTVVRIHTTQKYGGQ